MIDRLTTILDFSDPGSAPPIFNLAGGSTTDTDISFGFDFSEALAFEASVLPKIARLYGLDAENDSKVDPFDEIRRWIGRILEQTRAVFEAVQNHIEVPLIEEFATLKWLFSGDDQVEEKTPELDALFDLFWSGLGRSLLGVLGDVIRFGGLFERIVNEFTQLTESPENAEIDQQPRTESRRREDPPAETAKRSDTFSMTAKNRKSENSSGEVSSGAPVVVARGRTAAIKPSDADESKKSPRQR